MSRYGYLWDMVYYVLRSIAYAFWPRYTFYKDVSDEIVLITGGGLGLGRLMADRFSKLGAIIVIWDINEDNMKETEEMVKSTGGSCYSFICDVSDPKAVYTVAEKVRQVVGHPSIVIMNAGVVVGRNILDLKDEEIQRTFNVNTLSHFWLIKAFLPAMMRINEGHLVSIDSVSSYYGTYSLTDYSSSKAASNRLQEALKMELMYSGYEGIRVTSVMPYFMNTGMFDGSQSKFFSILQPEYVADEVVSAILSNKTFLSFHKFFFGGNMMSEFRGRQLNDVNDNSRTLQGVIYPDVIKQDI